MSIGLDFVERGYLPRELPACFTSASLAKHAGAAGLAAMNGRHAGGEWTRPARHNLARPAGLRRVLSVPNPLNFLRLAEAIEDAWTSDIAPLLGTTTIATSRPTLSLSPRALAAANASDQADFSARARSGHRYLLQTDILNFYPSVYTHSIPWVIHGKAAAKAKMKDTALNGNRIDKAVREGQGGQTMGIPIGPDTSWALAESVLASVENNLRQRLTRLDGHRYNDDFELFFPTLAQAEAAVGYFEEILSELELSLNPRKTSIVEMPVRVESSGIAELRSWPFRSSARGQQSDVIAYFDRLADLIQADRGHHTASYAVARLRTQAFLPATWPLLESCLLHLLVAEPYCARQIAITVSMLSTQGHSVDVAKLTEAAERLVVRHAALGHGSEVAWAIWLSIAHGATLTSEAAKSISTMTDSFVALLALAARDRCLVAGNLDTTLWEDAMTAEDLRGPHWLLSYEAAAKKWLPTKGSGNHLSAEPFFAEAAAAGVEFFDTTALTMSHQAPKFPPTYGGGGGGGGGYAD